MSKDASDQDRLSALQTAIDRMFAAESLYPLGNDTRKDLYQARIIVDRVRYRLNTAIFEKADAEFAERNK